MVEAMVMNKLLSGRYVLTVITGLVFDYVACTGIMEAKEVGIIVTAVFISYFQRTDRNGTKNP